MLLHSRDSRHQNPVVTDLADALERLGVDLLGRDALDAETAEQLDQDGYAFLPGVVTPDVLSRIRDQLRVLTKREGDRGGIEVGQEIGTARLSDLVNKGDAFDVCFTHPTILAGVHHLIGDFKLSSLSSRAALPGQGHQALHADWDGPTPAPGVFESCNTMWLLDDFTEENGATRVVPGSHRWGLSPEEGCEDPSAPHPDQRLVIAPAGSLLIFNGHLWHGGTQNRSDRPRRAMHGYFTRRHNEQQLDQSRYLLPATRDRLDPAARYLLDV